jgi:hypothetical protein
LSALLGHCGLFRNRDLLSGTSHLCLEIIIVSGTAPGPGVLLVELTTFADEDGSHLGAFRDRCVSFRLAAVIGPVGKDNASLSLPLRRGGCREAGTSARW